MSRTFRKRHLPVFVTINPVQNAPSVFISLLLLSGMSAEAWATDPPAPNIPDKSFSITDYGAVADGKTPNTQAIIHAIAACTAAGGGSVIVPAGKYLTAPFALSSGLNLHLEQGAVLLITDDEKQFQVRGNAYENCISADDCHDIAITGAGTIDGQGERWWTEFIKSKGSSSAALHRPFLVVLKNCNRVLIKGITLTNSPMFHLVPKECRDVTIDAVHFVAPAKAPNTDGLDPSGWNYLITRCIFDVGDDCIAIKPTGHGDAGQVSCEDFLITDCTFNHGHGMSIGGQTNGGLRRMIVRDCAFEGTEAGIRMKAGRGAGGLVEDVTYENLKMHGVKSPILISSFYPRPPKNPAADPAQPMQADTPIWRHIQITNLTSTDSPTAGQIIGLAESPVEDVVLTRVHISAVKGMQIIHAKGVRFVDSSIDVQEKPAIKLSDAEVSGMTLENGR
jgi:polygalacturonase